MVAPRNVVPPTVSALKFHIRIPVSLQPLLDGHEGHLNASDSCFTKGREAVARVNPRRFFAEAPQRPRPESPQAHFDVPWSRALPAEMNPGEAASQCGREDTPQAGELTHQKKGSL
ncbi:hypothetical protein VZT92_008424 [Zoarces viviparus]|uniref:Uncharacterized protein n=1 Tax=Zoarces viviparus TaxID=48416 RepID=A0AAW1FED4_ZOAVI